MRPTDVTRTMTLVVKTSKLCNLRCKYCYEFEELSKRDQMSRASLRRMYQHVADYYAAVDARDGERTCVQICWHGGEPLLVDPAFYWDTFADQKEIFGTRVGVYNIVQTNLVSMDAERVRLLRDGFDGVGVSIDLFGSLRVNIAGRDLQDTVLANMDRLRAEGVNVGCITVLHRGNIRHVDEIFRFYERARIGFRVLPLFVGATDEQNTLYELNADEITAALCRFADLWLESDNPIPVMPIAAQIEALVRHLNPDPEARVYYDKREWCGVLLVNTNGDCYTVGDPYGTQEWALGNLFTTPLGEVFDRSVRDTERRLAANCVSCEYFGGCDGRRIGDERHDYYEHAEGIPVCRLDRGVLTHLESRLRQADLIDASGRLLLPIIDSSADHPELVG